MPRTLLDLSRSYAAGQLDLQSYRRQRLTLIRQLLQATEDVTLPVRAGVPIAPVDDSTRECTPAQTVTLTDSERRMKMIIAASLLLIVFILVAVLGVRLVDAPSSSPGRNSEGVVSPAALPETQLQRHLAAMLSQESWSTVPLQQFRRAWQTSTEEVRLQTRQDPRYLQLVELLGSRVLVLEALDPEGNDSSITNRIQLIEQLRQQVSAVDSYSVTK
ncbi:MAG: hypothetical protein V7629_06815 [Motiliproteus sp.]